VSITLKELDMSILGMIASGKSYIDLVKEFIEKIFVHEAKKFQCEPNDLMIVIYREKDGQINIGTYSKADNKVLRIIPDKEAQNILMK
jgi:hypothetical protein